jgi:pSer/pThr/pTyr-binding forkhead associated (FHA) protein
MDKLYFLSGPLQGATAELLGEEITIGRASDNGICIDDESVSDHHAVINRQNRECVLRDLQSAKGTKVRGDKIIVVTLDDSDRIAFGSVEAEFTTTEIKLHMPKTAVLPPPVFQSTSRKRNGSAKAADDAPSFMFMLKAAMAKLLAFFIVLGILAGGYLAYQKYSNVNSASETPSQEPSSQVTPLPPIARAIDSYGRRSIDANAMAAMAPSASPQPGQTAAPASPPVTASATPSQPAQALVVPPSIASAPAAPPTTSLPPAPPPPPVAVPGSQSVPGAALVPGAAFVPGSASTAMPPQAPRSSSPPQRMVTQPAAVVNTDIRSLKAEDWVRGLPSQAQAKYFEIRVSLRGNERIEAFRAWIGLWRRALRDPNLALVELDYIKLNIDNKNPSLYLIRISRNDRSRWQAHEASVRLRLTILSSMDNLLRALRVRVPKHPELLTMIGEYTDLIADENGKLVDSLTWR